ncbi:MAG: tetratricopeptide repeat protein, partial [Candidatus Latescibacterota bacterium]
MFKTFVLLTCAVLIVAGAAGAATRGDEPFQEGMKSYDEGDWDAAIDSFEKAVESDESSSLYHTWLGRAYIAKLQTVSFFEKGVLSGRALEHLQKAVELDPANVDARVSLAGYYLNAPSIAGGSKKKARQQAEAIATYDEVTGNWIMARVLVEDEKYDEAIEAIEACVAARPENVDYRYQLAMVYQQQERYDEAFAEFENIVRIDPDAAGALY